MMDHSKPILTKDGSFTLYDPRTKQHYHSMHGAKQESLHVFIENGLNQCRSVEDINVLELGFGTGLNAILTSEWAVKNEKKVHYLSFDLYPLKSFGFISSEDRKVDEFWLHMMNCNWNEIISINEFFSLEKIDRDILSEDLGKDRFNLIYHDAFSPDSEPELWNTEILSSMYNSLVDGGIWVTYSAKGQLRRNLISCGFDVEKIPGPPGKREMLRAVKR